MRREQDLGFKLPPIPPWADKYISSSIWKVIQRSWLPPSLQMSSAMSQFLKEPSFKADSDVSLIKMLPATSTFYRACPGLVLVLDSCLSWSCVTRRHNMLVQIRWRWQRQSNSHGLKWPAVRWYNNPSGFQHSYCRGVGQAERPQDTCWGPDSQCPCSSSSRQGWST